MVEFKYWSPPCCLGITCVQSRVQLYWVMRLLESSGTQVKIFGLTVSIHILTLQSLRLLLIVSDLFFINSRPFLNLESWIPDPSSTCYSSSAECTAASHLIPAVVLLCWCMYWYCHFKVYWDGTFILMRYWWVLFSSIMVFWFYSELVFA